MVMVNRHSMIYHIIKDNLLMVKNMVKVDFVIMINIIHIIWVNLNKIKYQVEEYHRVNIINIKGNGFKVK